MQYFNIQILNKMYKIRFRGNFRGLTIMLILITGFQVVKAKGNELKLWYDKPAKDWMTEALPIGNGRLGGMIFGGIGTDRVQFNEISLWSGDETSTGAYQAFGDIFIDFKHAGKALHYKRELNIERAVHTTSYLSDGILFKREYFSSAKDQVMVMHISANRKGSCTGAIRMTDMHNGIAVAADQKLSVRGVLDNGLVYEAGLVVLNEEGVVKISEDNLVFENTNSITIILAAGTNYFPDYSKGWRGEDPHRIIEQQLKESALRPYQQLLSRHVADYQNFFNRVDLNVGDSDPIVSRLTTDKRLVAYKKGGSDPDLEELFFQFGRYLLISSSRPGSLPANLQGIWDRRRSLLQPF